jgi:glycerol-1-phosphate dehydrogenase [NAD(P)+]
MNLFEEIDDPTDLDRIRTVIAASERPDALVSLGISTLTISDTAADTVADELAKLLETQGKTSSGARVVVLMDSTPIYKAQTNLKDFVVAQLQERFRVTPVVLGDTHHLLADDVALDAATAALTEADAVVSVGSGTISDISKVASNRSGNIPYVMVQTAASVDGYTDNVSVILRAGAKRTIDSRWPDVVLADTTVIATAPRELNTSGFGELLSLFTAPADWWLASQIGTDHSFHTTPRDLLLTFAGNPGVWGAGIGDGNTAAVEQLTRVLAIRGIGTGIAGSTACLSGMEHLISHMLDMYAVAHHHEIGLHGTQVGVASVVGATAWEYLIEQIRAGRPITNATNSAQLEARVHAVFEQCDPTGALGAECWSDYSYKREKWQNSTTDISALVSDADQLLESLGAMMPSSRNLAEGLTKAGAAVSFDQLDDWVTAEIWRWAVKNCLYMRNRVTIVDLLAELGWWTDADVDNVLARVESLTREVAHV